MENDTIGCYKLYAGHTDYIGEWPVAAGLGLITSVDFM